MAASIALGGFTGPEADTLGYAIRKKKSDVLRAQKEKFVQRAAERGVPPQTIDAVVRATLSRRSFPTLLACQMTYAAPCTPAKAGVQSKTKIGAVAPPGLLPSYGEQSSQQICSTLRLPAGSGFSTSRAGICGSSQRAKSAGGSTTTWRLW